MMTELPLPSLLGELHWPSLPDWSELSDSWQNIVNFSTTRGLEFSLNALAGLVILLVGRAVARWLRRVVCRVATQAKIDETLVRFVTNLAYAAMLVFVVLSALNRVGIDTTSFTAVVGAAGLAVGFALQGSLSNFAAGVMLIAFKPFRVGDQVHAGGSLGTVVEIQIFNTLIRTDNNALIFVPNGSITNATITNFSADETRRIDIVVKCGYENDLRAIKAFLVELMHDDDRILQLPPPQVVVDQLGDNSISLSLQPWVRNEYFTAVRTHLLEAIKVGCEERGFVLLGHKATGSSSASGTVKPLRLHKSA